METPEAYLRALAAPLAQAQEGSPLPVARFSPDAVANAFVILGLLPAARAEEILTEQRPALRAAGIRLLVGRGIGELSVTRGARVLQEARGVPGSLRKIPLASAVGPVRCQLPSHGLTITSATLTPEGISVRYCGDPREGDDNAARGWGEEITGEITGLSITDDTGGTYLVPADKVGGRASGRRTTSGGMLWVPEGEFLAVPAPGETVPGETASGETGSGVTGSDSSRAAARWLEFSARPGQPARVEVGPSAAALTGTTDPPWPTPAECYLAQFAPPARDWSLGYSSIGTGELNTVDLDTGAIVTAVIDALLAIGALPPDSAVLAGLRDGVRSDRQRALRDARAAPGRAGSAGLAVQLPFERATAVIDNIAAREDMVSVQLYGHPWVGEPWPMIAPCFQVTAVDDTGTAHQGQPGESSRSPAHEGSGSFWFWPPVDPQAKQLRVTVSTLWEAAWALIDIPGR
jgi:hypothetical protein